MTDDRRGCFVVWYEAVGADIAPALDGMLAVLARAGVIARPRDAEEPEGPGVVFFDAATPALRQALRTASGHGGRRLLAIATRPPRDDDGWWSLLLAGATDVFAWPHSADPGGEVAARLARWESIDRLVEAPLVHDNLIGASGAWRELVRQVVEVACFTDAPVLLMGESGTGKELAARLIHSLDRRPRRRELVVVDCTTVAPQLAGSEFFGHERGAFTGALATRDGAFELANGGTLFLDEIGELPLELQAQLLRVVQERTYKRVGGNAWRRTEFRLVCATNRDLAVEVARGAFRADLFYRIAGTVCRLPPLRDRLADVVPLFAHFLAEFRPGAEPPPLDEAVRRYLVRREYPGNVRDLRQLAARVAFRHVGPGPITIGDIPADERPSGEADDANWEDATFEASIRRALAQGVTLRDIGRLAADAAIRIAVSDEGGSLQRAAQKLGVTDRALQLRKATRRSDGASPPSLRQSH